MDRELPIDVPRTEEEAERIASEYRRKMNRSGTKKKYLTKTAGSVIAFINREKTQSRHQNNHTAHG